MFHTPKMYITQLIVRQFSINSQIKAKNHYENLGITPKATQADVKSAYYKLSMVYHPDKNKGCIESSKNFRAITEAYEVLGNVRKRKLYDKGLYLGTETGYPVEDEVVDKFHKSRDIRSKPPTPTGRTVVYDFDEWSRNHYGNLFAREMKRKAKDKYYEKQKIDLENHNKIEHVILGVSALVLWILYYFSSKSNYDDIDDRTQVFGSIYVPPKRMINKNNVNND